MYFVNTCSIHYFFILLQLTMKIELGLHIPFLDILLIHRNGGKGTKASCKKINCGKVMIFS